MWELISEERTKIVDKPLKTDLAFASVPIPIKRGMLHTGKPGLNVRHQPPLWHTKPGIKSSTEGQQQNKALLQVCSTEHKPGGTSKQNFPCTTPAEPNQHCDDSENPEWHHPSALSRERKQGWQRHRVTRKAKRILCISSWSIGSREAQSFVFNLLI